MKVRDLIEQLHDLHGDMEVAITNLACGGGSDLERVEVAGEDEVVILIHSDENYMAQIEAKYRTICFAGVTRDGDFVDCKATSEVSANAQNAIQKAVQKADKIKYCGVIEI